MVSSIEKAAMLALFDRGAHVNCSEKVKWIIRWHQASALEEFFRSWIG